MTRPSTPHAPCRLPASVDECSGSAYDIKRKPEHFLRLASTDAGGTCAAGGRAAKSLAEAGAANINDPLFLKRRGLMMAVASLIIITPEKRIEEEKLIALLKSTGIQDSSEAGADDDDEDGDDGNVIPGWQRLLREDFVREEYFERTAVAAGEGGAAAGAGGGGKTFCYSLGPRLRATVGWPHILEFACATTGHAVPVELKTLVVALGPEAAGLHDLAKEVKAGVGRVAADAAAARE